MIRGAKKNKRSEIPARKRVQVDAETWIEYGMPEAEYRAAEGISYSDLKKFKSSPAEYRNSKLNPEDDSTEAKEVGSLIDDAIYSIEDFKKSYFRLPPGARKSQVSHVEKEFKLTHNASKELSAKVYDEVLACAEAFRAHQVAGEVIQRSQPENRELSFFWKDERTGLRMKGRIDLYDIPMKYIFDFKSTKDADDPFEYSKEFYKWGYHIQAALYTEGMRRCGFEVDSFCHAVVSKKSFLVYPYIIDKANLMHGEIEARYLLKKMARCIRDDSWPYGGETFRSLSLPSYAVSEIESLNDISN